ncbi:assembly of actin patch protein [Fusarium equiseti]|uniref:Assembly of actin patch protein n=1 Tax=Fusarium equiseti TaxID=61235 RepID=A0ABQ8R0R6_FUSEQ|nr:assembly of actin patch protein [Fusarium equiseti]
MAAPFKVKAIYEYSSPHEDDLNFGIGQVITVTDEEDADWYGGEYLDDQGVKQEGIFPRNFVEKFEPTAPPRPARTRTKKEPETAQPAEDIASPPPPPVQQAPPPVPAPEPEPEIEEAHQPIHQHAIPEASAPAIPESAPKPAEPAPAAAPPPPTVPKAAEPPAPAPVQPPATASPKPKPSGPPPVTEKPKSSSFKDRIAAFNKPAAPPVAPFKPSGLAGTGTGFVKKPFVAPPPSRNAFIPPPQQPQTAKVYRRDEDPEIKEREAETQGQAERAGLVPTEAQGGETEDQPKPTSLKERIALLQKQQQEQAARHADAAAKKEKPKKPQKKRESVGHAEAPAETEASPQEPPTPLERSDTQDIEARTSTDEPQATRMPPPPRRKSSKGPAAELVHDGNEADMSGAGDTTEGNDDLTEREDSDGTSRVAPRAPTLPIHAGPPPEAPKKQESDEAEEVEEEEEEEVDPEVRRKEELRARMAKMSGGMGFHGMFGAPMPAPAPPPKKKKPAPKPEQSSVDDSISEASPTSQGAPPIPAMMPLPGFGGPSKSEEPAHPETEPEPVARAPPPPVPSQPAETSDEDKDSEATPAPHSAPTIPPREPAGAPPVPGSRGAPPPVPSDSRPPPPPPADAKSQSDGSESGDELSGGRDSERETPTVAAKSPPMPPPPVQPPHLPSRSPPLSPTREDFSPISPGSNASNRLSRLPPPIPGSAPAPPTQSRPPPPPPPGVPRRQSTQDSLAQPRGPPQAGEEEAEELTEYEGDYDTDIASSVPHKDALKSHARDSSLEDNTLISPTSDAPANIPPPVPSAVAPRAVPPPVPSQPPPENKRQSMETPRAAPPPPPADKRPSVDVPRAAPPPPPPANILPPQPPQSPRPEEDYDPYNYSAPPGGHAYAPRTPKIEEETAFPSSPSVTSPMDRRPPPPAVPGRTSNRQSLDISRVTAGNRRSMDMHRPSMSMESGFIANDMDLAIQSGWWKQSNQVPPALQGRKDIYFETEESTSTNGGQQTTITREISILYQDYSQTFLTVRYDPYDPSDVQLEQRHEPPPRALRQDQMEEYYERFGRQISTAVASKKDSVVADGTSQGLVLELLKPYKDVLPPVGTRAYGALVYSNMANASTQQNDMIRAGDIITIRNAKFQGKHGPMHAKYSAEVGKPDHVAVVAEWDGTKKKVRAWEQGRESKKVKVESFKLDDLRSGEVKIWRVMPRSWVGWNNQS